MQIGNFPDVQRCFSSLTFDRSLRKHGPRVGVGIGLRPDAYSEGGHSDERRDDTLRAGAGPSTRRGRPLVATITVASEPTETR